MYETAQQPVYGLIFLKLIINTLLTRPAAELISQLEAHLFTAGPTPITPATLPADFTEADFDGYSAQAATPGAVPVNVPSGDGIALIADANYVVNSSTTPNTILGYWLEDGNGNMVVAEYFAAPVPLVNAGDFISLNVSIPLSFSPQVSI